MLLFVLLVTNVLRPFNVPSSAMSPTVQPGDHIMVEGFTFWRRKPARGDIVAFKTDGLPLPLPAQNYIKRIAGEPGERLRIADGRLYVNDTQVVLSNATSEIRYVFLRHSSYLASSNDTVTVPDGHYFVLGDNSTNSADGRFWGFLPAGDIFGHASFCYWPPRRIGAVR